MEEESKPTPDFQEGLSELKERLLDLEKERERLKDSFRKLQAVADHTYDCETWTGTDGKLVYVSPSCERISGYRPEEFLKDTSLFQKIIHPADQKMVMDHLFSEAEEKIRHMEFRIVSRRGEERWISHYCQPIYNEKGEGIGQLSSNRDITDRKRAEIELERVNRTLKVLRECSKAMVRSEEEGAFLREVCRIITEVGGYRLAWVGFAEDDENKSVIPMAEAGFDEGYLRSADVRWNADSERGRGPVGTAIRTGKSCICRSSVDDPQFAPWRTEALKRGYASMIGLPLTVGDRTIGGLNIYAAEADAFDQEEVKLLEDLAADLGYGISALRIKAERTQAREELKRAYEELELRVQERTRDLAKANESLKRHAAELERSNLELKRFTFVASHDLQEPLRKILIFGDLLQNRYRDALDERGQSYLEKIRRAADRMVALIKGILCHSQASRMNRPSVPVNLSEIAGKVLENLQEQVGKTGAQVEIAQLPIIDGEPSSMLQLLENLLSNALKFHREDEPPRVKIYARASVEPGVAKGNRRPNEGLYDIHVEDNGIGFDQSHLERIFSPFQRLHGGKYEGTGIGLAICRKIVESHGGSITARSVPGEGSLFIVTLPARQNSR